MLQYSGKQMQNLPHWIRLGVFIKIKETSHRPAERAGVNEAGAWHNTSRRWEQKLFLALSI